jgi:hypothetical protein
MSFEEMKSIFQNFILSDIYVSGVVFPLDEGEELPEFVPLNTHLFLEFGVQLIKFEAIEQYSKISIERSSTMKIEIDVEDVTPVKSKISSIIFDNNLVDNKVSKLELINMKVKTNKIICDALKLTLNSSTNHQELFFDPQYFGINIGGIGVEELWKRNQFEEYEYKITTVKF